MNKLVIILVFVFSFLNIVNAASQQVEKIEIIRQSIAGNTIGGIKTIVAIIIDDDEDVHLRGYAISTLHDHFKLHGELRKFAKNPRFIEMDEMVSFFREAVDKDFVCWLDRAKGNSQIVERPVTLYTMNTHSHEIVINSDHITKGEGSIIDLKLGAIIDIFESQPIVMALRVGHEELYENLTINKKANGNFFALYSFNDDEMNRRMLALVYPDVIVEDSVRRYEE